MGRYRARDMVNAPTLVSWVRLPLAALFPFTLASPKLSLVVLGAAGLSDVVDGWLARRFKLATPAGAVVDGVTDKVFVGSVLLSLVLTGRMTLGEVGLLGTREIGEIPLVLWLLASPAARSRKVEDRANVFGKVATTFQFATVVATLVGHDAARSSGLWATAVIGFAAAASYWVRTVRAADR